MTELATSSAETLSCPDSKLGAFWYDFIGDYINLHGAMNRGLPYIVSREYCHRIWIIQEVVLAHLPIIMVGEPHYMATGLRDILCGILGLARQILGKRSLDIQADYPRSVADVVYYFDTDLASHAVFTHNIGESPLGTILLWINAPLMSPTPHKDYLHGSPTGVTSDPKVLHRFPLTRFIHSRRVAQSLRPLRSRLAFGKMTGFFF